MADVAGSNPVSPGVIVAATATSRVIGRLGVRIPLPADPIALLAGMLWLSRLTAANSYLDVIWPLVIFALGVGCELVALTFNAVNGAAAAETAVASALVNTAQQIGGALGLSVLATVAVNAATSQAHALTAAAHGHSSALTGAIATTHGYATAFEVSAGIALIGLLISLLAIRTPRPMQTASGSAPPLRTASPPPGITTTENATPARLLRKHAAQPRAALLRPPELP